MMTCNLISLTNLWSLFGDPFGVVFHIYVVNSENEGFGLLEPHADWNGPSFRRSSTENKGERGSHKGKDGQICFQRSLLRQGSRCLSSCVFLAGALLNTVLRKFGFHDWLLMVPSLSVDHIQGVRVIKNNDILNLYIGICHTKWLRGWLVFYLRCSTLISFVYLDFFVLW